MSASDPKNNVTPTPPRVRSVRRALFAVACGGSALMAILIVILWIWSNFGDYQGGFRAGYVSNFPFGAYAEKNEFPITINGYAYVLLTPKGSVQFYWQEIRTKEKPLAVGSMFARVEKTFLGFGINRAPGNYPHPPRNRWANQGMVQVPFWFPLGLSLVIPVWWAVRQRTYRARRRIEMGLCPKCGYDLRATPDRCPECGTTQQPKVAIAFLLAISLMLPATSRAQTTRNYSLDTVGYDIRELIVNVEDPALPPEDEDGWPTDPAAAGGNAGQLMGRVLTGAERADAAKQRIVDGLIQRIRTEIDPASWRTGGVDGPDIQDAQGQLIITQTPETHEKIHALIERRLEAGRVQVTIETRFLTGNFGLDETKWIKAPDHQKWPVTLDETEVSLLLRTVQQDRTSTLLTAPRLTLFDGQRAFVVVATETAYVGDFIPKPAVDGALEYDPIVKIIGSGVCLVVRATVAQDLKSVDLELHPRLRKLIALDAIPFNVDGKQVGFVQVPTRAVARIDMLTSVPNRQSLLLKINPRVYPEGGPAAAPQPVMYLLVKATVIVQGKAAQPAPLNFPITPARGNTQ